LYTGLNCAKPLHIDDAAYYHYAVQIAAQPFDPYGFEILWYSKPQPANQVLAPLVVEYWWALAYRLFGEQPWLWKLWLLPFSVLFVTALYCLLRRLAGGLEWQLLLLTVLSPAFLPSLNLMLDVPALALSLAALALFLAACDRGAKTGTRLLKCNSRVPIFARGTCVLSLLAGLMAALAMQTKYTALLTPAVMALYGVLFGRVLLALVAALMAGLLFASWEVFLAYQYGESHFLFHLHNASSSLAQKLQLAPPLLSQFGGLTAAVCLLGLAALGCRQRTLVRAGMGMLVGYLLVLLVPDRWAAVRWLANGEPQRIAISDLVFAAIAVSLFGTVLTLLARLWRSPGIVAQKPCVERRLNWFLLAWLGLELAGYFAMTPFPAARRVLGLVVVSTLLFGREAARSCSERTRRVLGGITLSGMALGFGYYALDLDEALTQKQAVEAIVRQVHPEAGGSIWYVGHWGFQYYAERAGMKPVIPTTTLLRAGDYLVIPDAHVIQQSIALPQEALRLEGWYCKTRLLPLRMIPCFYGGTAPLDHADGDALRVRIYRVTVDFLAEEKEDTSSSSQTVGLFSRELLRARTGYRLGLHTQPLASCCPRSQKLAAKKSFQNGDATLES
jgi:hypothetical protein